MPPITTSVDVLILTPIAVEFDGIRSLMKNVDFFTDPSFQKTYCLGNFQKETKTIRIALRETQSGHLATANSLREGIQIFRPQIVVLFGTAGGLRKAQVGDIVVATAGCSYESGKVVDNGFYNNSKVLPTSPRILEKALALSKQPEKWKHSLVGTNIPAIKVYLAPIVSGDKVVASDNAPLRQLLKERFYDAAAIEMEAYAFLNAAQFSPDTETVIIRGVADLLGDKEKANSLGSKKLAVTNAAAFLHALLFEDDVLILTKNRRSNWFKIGLSAAAVGMLLLFVFSKTGSQNQTSFSSTFPVTDEHQELNTSIPTSTSKNPEDLEDNQNLEPSVETPNLLPIPPNNIEQISTRPSAPSESVVAPPLTTDASVKDTISGSLVDTLLANTISDINPAAEEGGEKISPTPSPEVKKYTYRIFLLDQNDNHINGASYFIDGQPISLSAGFKVYLPADDYELEIRYSHYEPLKLKIHVPTSNKGRKNIRLFTE